MTRQFLLRQGEDETPEYDLTEPTSPVHVIWEEMEVGGRAFRGESDAGIIPMRDEQGETGSHADLPSGLELTSLSRGSTWEWLERAGEDDEVVMARGRIGPKDYTRGRQKASRAREVAVTTTDSNEHLQLIIIDDWIRPEETDVERVTALLADYLNGDPRPTTVIADTYVSADNPVTLDAHTYDGSSPHEVLQDIALKANKNFFVTVDNELFYDSWESTAYPASVRISDRESDWTAFGLACSDLAATGVLGANCSLSGSNFDSVAVPDAKCERVVLTTTADAVPGQFIVVITGSQNNSANIGVWDDAGNEYVLAANHGDSAGTPNPRASIWYANVTNPLQAGENIVYEVGVGGSLIASLERGGKCLSAYVFDGLVISATESGTNEEVNGSAGDVTVGAGDLIVAAFDENGGASGMPDVITVDPDWTAFDEASTGNEASDGAQIWGGFRLEDADGETYNFTIDQNRDWAGVGAVFTVVGGSVGGGGEDGEGLPTFGPIWDVGAASTEDGLDLRCGMRLYYGEAGAYVYHHDDVIHDRYWHAEESVVTSDPTITDATKAMALLLAMYERRKEEERTYNVSIGPLTEDQVGCIKYGQLIYIKARAIPDADDAFMPRRIAQLRWTTPRPGVFFARMQLSRPRKQEPYSVGPKDAVQATTKHATAGTHPASNITITDSGGYFSGNDVEAALQELGVGTAGAFLTTIDGEGHTLNTVAASGSTETLDLGDGNLHDVTLTDDCTFTFAGATNGVGCYLALILRQDGTGGHAVTWPASVEWPGGVEPELSTDPNAVDVLSFLSDDGGTTWFGTAGSSGGGGSGSVWHPVMAQDPSDSKWYVVVDGDGTAVMAEAP